MRPMRKDNGPQAFVILYSRISLECFAIVSISVLKAGQFFAAKSAFSSAVFNLPKASLEGLMD